MSKIVNFRERVQALETEIRKEIRAILKNTGRNSLELPKYNDGEGADWDNCLVVSYHNGFTGESENVTVYKIKVLADGTIKLYLEGEFGDKFTATAEELSTDDLCALYETICGPLETENK